MARTNPTQVLLDRAIDGGLEKFLTDRRAAGDSYAAISLTLRDEHGVTITAETLRQWCRTFDIAKAEPEAAAS